MAIDSGPLTAVTYGGNRTDIAGAFPGFSNRGQCGRGVLPGHRDAQQRHHQIGWYVVDNCGRADGIGSRFFTVLNGGSAIVPTDRRVTPAAEATTVPSVEWNPVRVQRRDQTWHWSYPNAGGTRIVGVEQGERIEVQLPALEDATYAGARLDARRRSVWR